MSFCPAHVLIFLAACRLWRRFSRHQSVLGWILSWHVPTFGRDGRGAVGQLDDMFKPHSSGNCPWILKVSQLLCFLLWCLMILRIGNVFTRRLNKFGIDSIRHQLIGPSYQPFFLPNANKADMKNSIFSWDSWNKFSLANVHWNPTSIFLAYGYFMFSWGIRRPRFARKSFFTVHIFSQVSSFVSMGAIQGLSPGKNEATCWGGSGFWLSADLKYWLGPK